MSAALRSDYAAAAAVVLAGDGHQGHIYELGGDSFTLGELAAAITASSGVPVRYRDLSIHALRTHLLRQGVDPAVVTLLLQVDQSIARGDLFTGSGGLAELLGRPAISLPEALLGHWQKVSARS